MFKKIFFIFVFVGLITSCGGNGDTIEVKIFSAQKGSELATFKAEIADDAKERSMGLMFRKELGKNRGMLFIFDSDSTGAFWMLNTLIPLDIIFIGADRHIVSMVQEAVPQTTTPRNPEGPYRYVLEIPGGRAAQLGIKPGDAVQFEL